jgi:hypothetical protein
VSKDPFRVPPPPGRRRDLNADIYIYIYIYIYVAGSCSSLCECANGIAFVPDNCTDRGVERGQVYSA